MTPLDISYFDLVLDGINVPRFSAWSLIHRNNLVPIRNIRSVMDLPKNDYQCIITNTRFYPMCIIGWILSKFCQMPLIHLEHGSCHIVFDSSFVSTIRRIYDHTLGSLLVRSVTMNFGTFVLLVEFLNYLDAKNTKVVHNDADLTAFEGMISIGHAKTLRRIVIFYVGRLVYSKVVHNLVSILLPLKENIQLPIVGAGPYWDEFEPPVHHYSERVLTTVLAICTADCAVVAIDVGGSDEVVYDGTIGFSAKSGDQQRLAEMINFLLEDERCRNTSGENVKAYVMENFLDNQSMWQWMTEVNCSERSTVYTSNKPWRLDRMFEKYLSDERISVLSKLVPRPA